jgi:hypothetical protein
MLVSNRVRVTRLRGFREAVSLSEGVDDNQEDNPEDNPEDSEELRGMQPLERG